MLCQLVKYFLPAKNPSYQNVNSSMSKLKWATDLGPHSVSCPSCDGFHRCIKHSWSFSNLLMVHCPKQKSGQNTESISIGLKLSPPVLFGDPSSVELDCYSVNEEMNIYWIHKIKYEPGNGVIFWSDFSLLKENLLWEHRPCRMLNFQIVPNVHAVVRVHKWMH